MRTERDLRLALRELERETPDAQRVLNYVTERTSTGIPGRKGRPGRQFLAGVAAAAAVVAIVVAAIFVTGPLSAGRARPSAPSPQEALRSMPPYYMELIAEGSKAGGAVAYVRNTVTGALLAVVQPPLPYFTFMGVTGAADGRTFVLTAQETEVPSNGPDEFYEARFNPVSNQVTLTPLSLPGLPPSDAAPAAALSPDGTRLAVIDDLGPPKITVYPLPSGTAKTWSAPGVTGSSTVITDALSWSGKGILAFTAEDSQYLLNTNSRAGSLLANSRKAFCLAPSVNPGFYAGYLTPDGKTIVAFVQHPVPIGQSMQSCSQPARVVFRVYRPTALEQFSTETGQATGIVHASFPSDASIYWSNSSGGVLVVDGMDAGRRTIGVLSGGKFAPVPGVIPNLVFQLAF